MMVIINNFISLNLSVISEFGFLGNQKAIPKTQNYFRFL